MTPDTHLLRQVHPRFIQEGQLTSQAFFPFPKDEGMLSVYDGDQIEPPASHEHYVQQLRLASAGVWAVTCREADSIGLQSRADPLENFPQHALIDFSGRTDSECRKLAKRLKAMAEERGCLFAPD